MSTIEIQKPRTFRGVILSTAFFVAAIGVSADRASTNPTSIDLPLIVAAVLFLGGVTVMLRVLTIAGKAK